MGKQVNFYMLEEDEAAFMAFVLKDNDVAIVAPANIENAPLIFDCLPAGPAPFANFWLVYLWKGAQPLFRRGGIMQAGPLTGKTLYWTDDSQSSVIEFHRSFLRSDVPDTLVGGRLHADTHRLTPDNQAFEYKGEAFEKWYDGLARWIRRRYQRVGGKYVGPHAFEWHQAGGTLQP